jgi:hypothetical protein
MDTTKRNVDILTDIFEPTSIFHSLEQKISLKTSVLFLRYQIFQNHPYGISGWRHQVFLQMRYLEKDPVVFADRFGIFSSLWDQCVNENGRGISSFNILVQMLTLYAEYLDWDRTKIKMDSYPCRVVMFFFMWRCKMF